MIVQISIGGVEASCEVEGDWTPELIGDLVGRLGKQVLEMYKSAPDAEPSE